MTLSLQSRPGYIPRSESEAAKLWDAHLRLRRGESEREDAIGEARVVAEIMSGECGLPEIRGRE